MRSFPLAPARLGTGIGALVAGLLWTGPARATDAVWCHQVGRGDTLAAVARRYGVEIGELRGLNRLATKVAGAFHELFGQRLRITSLTRTRGAQTALIRINPSAAPAHGPVQSTHLAGAAVDVSKRFMSDDQVAWARTVLSRLEERDLIDVAEEFREPHFHVLVRRGYGTYGPTLASPILAGGC